MKEGGKIMEQLNHKVMKALINLLIAGCLFSANNLSAQQTKDAMLPVVTITASGTNVNEKVRKAFESSFKNAREMRWYEANKNYLVKFIQDDQEHNVLYRKNGSTIYHITYGYEKNLPRPARNLVKSRYQDFKIARVFNIKQNRRDVWIVNLENPDYMVLSRIEDNILNEVKRSKNVSTDNLTATAKQ